MYYLFTRKSERKRKKGGGGKGSRERAFLVFGFGFGFGFWGGRRQSLRVQSIKREHQKQKQAMHSRGYITVEQRFRSFWGGDGVREH